MILLVVLSVAILTTAVNGDICLSDIGYCLCVIVVVGMVTASLTSSLNTDMHIEENNPGVLGPVANPSHLPQDPLPPSCLMEARCEGGGGARVVWGV